MTTNPETLAMLELKFKDSFGITQLYREGKLVECADRIMQTGLGGIWKTVAAEAGLPSSTDDWFRICAERRAARKARFANK